jgi:hypothetical protein
MKVFKATMIGLALVGAMVSSGAALKHAYLKHEALTFLVDQMRQGMKDPDSAKFEDLVLYHQGSDPWHVKASMHGRYIVCGLVNGKNAYGGYSGYHLFIAASKIETGDPKDHFGPWAIDDLTAEDLPEFEGRWCRNGSVVGADQSGTGIDLGPQL